MGTKATDLKNQYNKDNYSRIALYFPKAEKQAISSYCKENNIPQAEFIKDLIYNKIGDYIKDYIDELEQNVISNDITNKLDDIVDIADTIDEAISYGVFGKDEPSVGQEK